MTTFAFLHQKGGTGKSTLAITAAQALATRGRAVLVLDVDYQGTASAWGEHFAEDFNVGVSGGVEVRSQVQQEIGASLTRFAPLFDDIVIDAPPTLSELSRNVLLGADRVLVPTRPAWPDVWALATVAGLVAQAGRQPRVEVVFNQVDTDIDLAGFKAHITELGLTVSALSLPRAEAFTRVFSQGAAGAEAITAVARLLAEP